MKGKSVLLEKDLNENYTPTKDENWVKNSKKFEAIKSDYLVGRIYMKVDRTEVDRNKYRKIKQEINVLLN